MHLMMMIVDDVPRAGNSNAFRLSLYVGLFFRLFPAVFLQRRQVELDVSEDKSWQAFFLVCTFFE